MWAWESTTASMDEPGEGEIAVQPLGFFAASLKHAAIEQEMFAVGFEPVHGAGDAAGRALKCEIHSRSGYRSTG